MRINAESLDPNMSVTEALAEIARVRKEQARARNIKGLAKFREAHHEKVLETQRAYREAHREELARKNREYRIRKKIQAEEAKTQDNFLPEKNILVT